MNKINFDDMIKKADEVLEYYYKNPDEENAPSPPHESHYCFFDDNDLNVNNIAAFIIPEFEIEKTVKSVKYVVDGTYDGEEFLHNKLKRIIDNEINSVAITGQTEVTENDD